MKTQIGELVRWEHDSLGVVFDTVKMYRQHCGNANLNLNIIVPNRLKFI